MKTIKFKNIFGSEIRSRNAIDAIVSKMKDPQDDYIFDMDGITFISRSFADELYNLKMNYGNVMFVNKSNCVCQMMDVVWKGRQTSRVREQGYIEVEDMKKIEDFKNFLMSM